MFKFSNIGLAKCASAALLLWLCAANAFAGGSRSIGEWVSCSGTADDTPGATAAFAAAKNGAFTLLVDCPVRLHSGIAVDRGIFIDNGTTVEFTGAGKFFVDNMFHPAFVIANSTNVWLVNWNVEWDGSVPVDPNFGGYELNGRFVPSPGITQPAAAFNDLVLTNWLATNRSISFNESSGWIKSIWVGGINPAAVFFITGSAYDVNFVGMKLYAPPGAGGNGFIPMAFSLSPNWRSNQTVRGTTPTTAQYAAVPSVLTFSNIELDGILMGWQGNAQGVTIENITARRYGDLQDANGANVGGIGKWFPPPHLFYLNAATADPALYNANITFFDVVDDGPRVGMARDKGGSDSTSGFANSLKLGCNNCAVTTYLSNRPDGFMDVLPSVNLTLTNVFATFDSAFINNLYPGGLRFPSSGYSHVTYTNVYLWDSAQTTLQGPIGNATSASNNALGMSGFHINLNRWAGSGEPIPTIAGRDNTIEIDFVIPLDLKKVTYVQKNTLGLTTVSTPTSISSGSSTQLSWNAVQAGSCDASGAWSGSLATSGSRVFTLGNAGSYAFTVACQSNVAASSATMSVQVQ